MNQTSSDEQNFALYEQKLNAFKRKFQADFMADIKAELSPFFSRIKALEHSNNNQDTEHISAFTDIIIRIKKIEERHAAGANLSPEIVERMAKLIRDRILKETAPLNERLSEIENDAMRFRGAFQRPLRYSKGDFVTSDGAGWVCLREINGADGKPGGSETTGAWQLAVKSR